MLSCFLKSQRLQKRSHSLRGRKLLRLLSRIKTLFLATFVIGLAPQLALGQETPPVRIGAFEYQYATEHRIHMNFCRAQECVPGSKVSYILYPPVQNPDFEEYKQSQKAVLSALKKHAPKDVTIIMGDPERVQNEIWTSFSSSRQARSADGQQTFTTTTLIYTKYAAISLISSSPDKEAVEGNASAFLVGLITWSQAQSTLSE